MDKCCYSSDDKQLPSTFQLLDQPDSSNVDNPNNSQNSAKLSGVSSVVEAVSCTRSHRGKFVCEGQHKEAPPVEVGKTIVSLGLSAAKDKQCSTLVDNVLSRQYVLAV